MNTFSVSKKCASFNFHNKDDEVNIKNRFDGSLPHYGLFHKAMNYLRALGFAVEKDPHTLKHYKRIAKDHYYGRLKDLEFKANRYPAGFKIEFFQNVNFDNPCGGEYDFDKFDKMPYIIKLMFINTANKLAAFLSASEIQDITELELTKSEEKIKRYFVESWHHEQNDMNFKLSDLDGETAKYGNNNKDRDGTTIYNGDVKYFRWFNGYLMRGKVYHNINNMWWVILNDRYYTNIADFSLFDLKADDKRGRLARHRPPKEYLERKEKISQTSTKELINELKSRGKTRKE